MAFKNILVSVAVVAFATSSAYASPLDTTKSGVLLPRNGCYSGGESFTDAGFPAGDTTWITNACLLLAQTYSPSSTKSQCVTGTNTADRVNIDVENNSDNDAALTSAEYVILVLSN
jgi:hypothetical protein